jgi:hypothetical protein
MPVTASMQPRSKKFGKAKPSNYRIYKIVGQGTFGRVYLVLTLLMIGREL